MPRKHKDEDFSDSQMRKIDEIKKLEVAYRYYTSFYWDLMPEEFIHNNFRPETSDEIYELIEKMNKYRNFSKKNMIITD